MELRTERVPTRRVLGADDGAPLDGDRILAVGLRWADRPLSLEHVKLGETRAPLDGVEIRWEGSLPVFATTGGTRAWVERSPGQWVDPGRRTALELGETLIIQSGELTLEARLQRRSEMLPPGRKQENLFFGLVMAHSLMFFVAAAVAMVITPRTDVESMWGTPSLLKRPINPLAALPERKKPALEDRVNEVVKNATFRPVTERTQKKSTAQEVMTLLFGGGGAGLFSKHTGSAVDAALNHLGPPVEANGNPGYFGRDTSNGLDSDGLSLGKLGPGRGPGPTGLRPGIRGHHAEVVLCKDCLPPLAAGYDRDLVLKVVRRHQNEIRFCYESELSREPSLAGKVTVAWVIGPSGAVASAQIAESGLANQSVEDCIVQRVRRWNFPEPSGGQEVVITFPWVFQVAGSAEE